MPRHGRHLLVDGLGPSHVDLVVQNAGTFVWEEEGGDRGVHVMGWTKGGVGMMKGRKEVKRAAVVVERPPTAIPVCP
jgi:hypothetical protein